MQPELLLFDIGNTSIKVGLANECRVLTSYTLPANAGHTPDSLGLTLLALLRHAGTEAANLTACVASSVVPGFDPLLREAVARYLDCPLYCAPDDLPIPLENRYERPSEVGADRLVGAFAARRLCPDAASLLVVDFGTDLSGRPDFSRPGHGPGRPVARGGQTAQSQSGHQRARARAGAGHRHQHPARSGLRFCLYG